MALNSKFVSELFCPVFQVEKFGNEQQNPNS